MDKRELMLERRISRLEKLVANEGTRYTYEWETNLDKAEKIYIELLKNPVINPEGYTIKDFKVETVYDALYLKSDKITLNTDCQEFRDIINKNKNLKTYSVQFADHSKAFGNKSGTYFALIVKQKVRKSYWQDPESGSDYSHDDYMSTRRSAEWGRAQRNNRDWW